MDILQELGISMVEIPAGEFLMGAVPNDPDAGPYEKPEHAVYLDAYSIADVPVTNAAFAAYVEQLHYSTTAQKIMGCQGEIKTWLDYAPGHHKHQVVCVSWEDAAAFCVWLSMLINRTFQLPTEAQWEKAARGGQNRTLYPWGNESPEEKTCWNRADVQPIGTLPVRTFPAYGYGIYGMAGNVWEWCRDWYEAGAYVIGPHSNPEGLETGTLKVRRGGAWNVREPFRLRCSNRGALQPQQFWPNTGFRIVEEF